MKSPFSSIKAELSSYYRAMDEVVVHQLLLRVLTDDSVSAIMLEPRKYAPLLKVLGVIIELTIGSGWSEWVLKRDGIEIDRRKVVYFSGGDG